MNPTLMHAVSPADLAAVARPIGEANGMPNAAYTSAEFFAFERDHLFAKTWTALAFCDDHATAGKVTPVDFMGLPLLIIGDADGDPTVFHNVCSHRGMRLVNAAKQTNGLLVCPYHAWSYDLAGNLKATPHIGGVGENNAPGFCRDKHGLKPVRSYCWMGILFINIDANAADFTAYAEPLIARYNRFIGDNGEAELIAAGDDGGITFTARCNWKLAVENYCEAYHLPWIHPSLNVYSPLQRHYAMDISADFAGQGTDTFNPALAGVSESENLTTFSAWAEDKYEVAEYPTFYPNLLLGYQVNHFYALIIQPLAADQIREEVRIFYIGEAASGDGYAAARQANRAAWQKVFDEDINAIEELQRGRASPGFRGGVFSPTMDAPTHHFHRWVARKYCAAYDEVAPLLSA